MFETSDRRHQWSWPAFWIQQLIAPLGSLFAAGSATLWLAGFFYSAPKPLKEWAGALDYAYPLLAGFMLGFVARRFSPKSNQTGRWVWVLPVLVCVLGFVFDLTQDPANAISTFFKPNGSEQGMNLFFFVYPAVASGFYSLGVLVASRCSASRADEKATKRGS
ncbi:MAG: hypothetical protein HYX25_06080 [Candidatus Solibacter usitatus]|nr:hypothetical protein [Candidatus Solibacter usitatus]